jgi:hypothetical protein
MERPRAPLMPLVFEWILPCIAKTHCGASTAGKEQGKGVRQATQMAFQYVCK